MTASSTEPAVIPSADSNAAFYYNNIPQTQQLPQNPEQIQPQYQPNPSPQMYHSTVPPQKSPQQYAHQPVKQQQQVPIESSQSQTPYWQGSQQNVGSQQAWQAQGSTYNGYTQESFPSAPHHAPQQKIVEESLIDL